MADQEAGEIIEEVQYIPVGLPAWIAVPEGGVARFLGHVNHMFRPVGFDKRWTRARVRRLPFYERTMLVELTNQTGAVDYSKYILVGPRSYYVIDWTVEAIYKANEHGGLHLQEGTAVAYVEFFSEYVFTADGQRFPLTHRDELPFQPHVEEAEKEAIWGRLVEAGFHPPELTGVYRGDGSFRVELFDLSKTDISRSTIFVTKTGEIDWIVTALVLADLPVFRRDVLV